MLLGQLVQRLVECQAGRHALADDIGTLGLGQVEVDGIDSFGRFAPVLWRTPAPTAKLVEGCVRRDSVHPRRKGAAPVEGADAAGDGDHGFLGGIEGVVVVAEEPAAEGKAALVVAPQQRLECCPIPLAGGRDEIRLVVGGVTIARLIERRGDAPSVGHRASQVAEPPASPD